MPPPLTLHLRAKEERSVLGIDNGANSVFCRQAHENAEAPQGKVGHLAATFRWCQLRGLLGQLPDLEASELIRPMVSHVTSQVSHATEHSIPLKPSINTWYFALALDVL